MDMVFANRVYSVTNRSTPRNGNKQSRSDPVLKSRRADPAHPFLLKDRSHDITCIHREHTFLSSANDNVLQRNLDGQYQDRIRDMHDPILTHAIDQYATTGDGDYQTQLLFLITIRDRYLALNPDGEKPTPVFKAVTDEISLVTYQISIQLTAELQPRQPLGNYSGHRNSNYELMQNPFSVHYFHPGSDFAEENFDDEAIDELKY
jgi:hypothetical protein